jgi:ABC-type Fe3+-hydroxamate transport system substrate-binding protein
MKYFNQIFDIPKKDYLMLYDALLEKRANLKKDEENGFPYVGKDYTMEDIDTLAREMWEIFNLEDRFSKREIPV